jgi:hypothetical protein
VQKLPIVTPEELYKKAARQWKNVVKALVAENVDTMFPMRIRAKLKPDKRTTNLSEMNCAVQRLFDHSQPAIGYGYTVHCKPDRSRQWGNQTRSPSAITIENLQHYIRWLDKTEEAAQIQYVCDRVRGAFSRELDWWLLANSSTLCDKASIVDQLIAVTVAMQNRKQERCFVRELDVPADTKFVQRHKGILGKWWKRVLPETMVDHRETRFYSMFKLKDRNPHQMCRLLDLRLLNEFKFSMDEFSAPIEALNQINVWGCNVVVVENRTNLLTLPPITRGIALGGVGNAVIALMDIEWLSKNNNRVFYWGDIDAEGFQILNHLRSTKVEAVSLMMNQSTLDSNWHKRVPVNIKKKRECRYLTIEENEAYQFCLDNNVRLEQEIIPQSDVVRVLDAVGLIEE